MIQITKEVRAEIAHRLHNHSGKCRQIHGHSYRFEITVESKAVNKNGMVIDFANLKTAIMEIVGWWDHKLILFEEDPLSGLSLDGISIIKFPYIPTAENMAKYLGENLEMPKGCCLESVRVWETDTSFAEWRVCVC